MCMLFFPVKKGKTYAITILYYSLSCMKCFMDFRECSEIVGGGFYKCSGGGEF